MCTQDRSYGQSSRGIRTGRKAPDTFRALSEELKKHPRASLLRIRGVCVGQEDGDSEQPQGSEVCILRGDSKKGEAERPVSSRCASWESGWLPCMLLQFVA